jgi:Yip1-like protein
MTNMAAASATESTSIWEDFADIFTNPVAVFNRRRDGKFGLVLLVLAVIVTVLSVGLHNGLAPIIDAETSRATAAMLAKNPQLTSDQLSMGQNVMAKFAMYGAGVFVVIVVLISGVVVWVASRIVGAKESFAVAMMIATYSQFPHLVETISNALQGMFLSPSSITSRYSVSLSPARFLSADTNPFVLSVVGAIDVFTLWSVALVGVGLYVTARIGKDRAAIAAALVWLAGLVPAIFAALRS